MGFARDHGTCLMILPLKLGVSLVAMLTFVDSITCIVASLTGDIRFQPNGYNQHMYRVPSFIGVPGLFFGFIGILGIYDDKPGWVRALLNYLYLKVVAIAVSSIADYWTLQKCDSWLSSSERIDHPNEQLTKVAESGVCPWARLSYAVGMGIVFLIWLYCTYKLYTYLRQIDCNPTYPVDFGYEKHDVQGRWQHFQVKDPRPTEADENDPLLHEKQEDEEYGSMTIKQDDVVIGYGPDGQPLPSKKAREMVDF